MLLAILTIKTLFLASRLAEEFVLMQMPLNQFKDLKKK